MAPKRPLADDATPAAAPEAKKARKGFRVGPENLPDGPWRRKITKVKQDLIQKAKIKKAYAKVKAAEQEAEAAATTTTISKAPADGPDAAAAAAPEPEEPEAAIHPERQAMLDEPEAAPEPATDRPPRRRGPDRGRNRPGYFDKATAEAERKKAEAEAREQEYQRRTAERQRKLEERERFRKAMKKARTPGRDGQRRLGRESSLMLEKAKKLMNEGK